MDLGLSFDKVLIILVIALFLIGPERLPRYAAQLGRLARSVRDVANGAKDRMREEMGPEFDEVEWSKLDPRHYDPRRIIREALSDSGEDERPASMMKDIPDDYPAAGAGMSSPARADSAEGLTRSRYVESAYEKRIRARSLGTQSATPAPYDTEST